MAAVYQVRFEKRIAVRCYAGYKGDERPTAFELAGRSVKILEIVDRWYDPDSNYFKVLAEDGASYLLRHDLNSDAWGLIEDDQNG